MGNNNELNNDLSAVLYLDDSIDCKGDPESAQCTAYFLNYTGETAVMSDCDSSNPEQLKNKVLKQQKVNLMVEKEREIVKIIKKFIQNMTMIILLEKSKFISKTFWFLLSTKFY